MVGAGNINLTGEDYAGLHPALLQQSQEVYVHLDRRRDMALKIQGARDHAFENSETNKTDWNFTYHFPLPPFLPLSLSVCMFGTIYLYDNRCR